ncbi:MAG: serine/threonine-protein kinase, partial [Planctomycetota bacterium]
NCVGGCPARDTWRQWLDRTSIGEATHDSMQSRLDGCQRCRELVESLSATDPFFAESRSALSGLVSGDLDAKRSILVLDEGIDASESAKEQDSPLLAVVRSLLGPTDDETAIGCLGRFAVTGIIGSGGMGIVLKARSLDVDRVVAIKIPQPQHWQATGTLLTIEREARSAAAVVHPNVISIYHVDRYRDVPYLVMPYLSGESLEQRLRRLHGSSAGDRGRLNIAGVLRILRQVAAALKAAHSCGVIHRDVKPANILLVGGTERAVLSDFGLAKIQSDATCTATGTFAGTPIYLSPEQASGRVAGPASDMFSLGTVLWTMLAGEPPFAGLHTHAIIHRIAGGEIPRLPDSGSRTPDYLLRLLAKLHDPDPASRPDAESMLEWIEQCERYETHPDRQMLPKALTTTGQDRRGVSIGLFAATVLIACLLSGLMLLQGCLFDVSKKTKQPGIISQPDVAPIADQDDESSEAEVLRQEPMIPSEDDVQIFRIRDELDQLNREDLPAWEERIRALEEKP